MTTAAAPGPKPLALDALLSRSWALFRTNWIVALPPFIASAVVMIAGVVIAGVCIAAAIAHGTPDSWSGGFIASLAGAYLLFIALVLVGVWWASVAMIGMANAVWERGTTTFGDGMAAFRNHAGASFVLGLAHFGLAIVAVIIALPTLFLSVLVLPFVTMYAFPSVVAGGRGGIESLRESFNLIRDFFAASVIVYLVLYAIQYGISLLLVAAIVPLEFSMIPATPDALPHMPPIGMLAFSGIIYFATVVALVAYGGFHAIALVGMYRDLVALPSRHALPPAGSAPVVSPVA